MKTEPKTKSYSTQAGDQNELQRGREPSPARKIAEEKQILGGGESKTDGACKRIIRACIHAGNESLGAVPKS
jgi:hypothetical protein